MNELSPVELRGGIHYKREDLYTLGSVNGSKLRSAQHIFQRINGGWRGVVVGASVGAPTPAILATVAESYSMDCEIIVGGTTAEKALKHRPIEIAAAAGASVSAIGVGYGPALKKAAAARALADPSLLPMYGTTTDVGLAEFLEVVGEQTANLPDELETLVVPFGSGNTGAGVLYGLHDARPAALRDVVLMEIGPSRRDWAMNRLASVGRTLAPHGVRLHWITLHGDWATYGQSMPETLDGIVFHPRYEGKMIRWLNLVQPPWWASREGTTGFWIVGGPL